MQSNQLFTVTDLKQFAYCPRVSYYEHCLPAIRPRTYKMDAGRDAHAEQPRHAARRSLRRMAIADGTRHFDMPLSSNRLSLTGVIDEVIETSESEWIPVDYKLTKTVRPNHRVQLCAYALLLEEACRVSVSHGFIYLIPKQTPVRVAITDRLREDVRHIVLRLQQIIQTEAMPPPHPQINRCIDCEFRRFCNDTGL